MHVPAARVVACAGKGIVDCVVRFGEVDGDAQRGLDVVAVEVAEEVVGGEGVWIDCCDVVVVAAGVVDVGFFEVGAAGVTGIAANFIEGCVGADEEGVVGGGEGLAEEDLGEAAGVGAGVGDEGCFV